MSMTEAGYIVKKKEDEYIDEWNRTRLVMYSVFQSQSTKDITPEDVMKFSWDKKCDSQITTKEDREKLIKHGLEMENKLNKNNLISNG